MECRLCLCSAPVESSVSIHNSPYSLLRHIWTSCQLQVKKDDQLPDMICLSCFNNLEALSSFRNDCLKSDKTSKLRLEARLPIKMEEVLLEDLTWEEEPSANSTPHVYNSPVDENLYGEKITEHNRKVTAQKKSDFRTKMIEDIEIPPEAYSESTHNINFQDVFNCEQLHKLMTEAKNSVKYLQRIVFSSLELQEKLIIKALGRLTPDLKISQTARCRMQSYERKFNSKIYNQYDWLTGCAEKNALFCFPCLLFGNDSSWTKTGVTDLKHLSVKIRKHEKSTEHLKNVCNLGILGTVDIQTQLSEAYRQEINEHNEEVKMNREILSKLIDCIVFCGKFELPLRGHDETDDAANPGVFRGLLEYFGKLDDNLINHFLNSSVFKESSKIIKNELLECILSVCKEEIRSEIQRAKYLALMADDTNDVSEHAQQVIVFRYELEGKVYERFWGFFNPISQDAEGLAVCIEEQLKIVLDDDHDKLIAQTYDGAAVVSGEKGGVQKIIKKSYKNAHFIHCYAHQLNVIIEKAASKNTQVRIFFSSLAAIPAYFAKSPSRLAALEGISKRNPQESSTEWNFNSGVVNTVFDNKQVLIQCFESLQVNRNTATVQGAARLLCTLNDDNFNFWLDFFHEIMPHIDVLYCRLQDRNSNSSVIREAVKVFSNIIDEKRNDLPSINGEHFPAIKKAKSSKEYNNIVAAKEVCDCIIFQIKKRFHFSKHLSAAKLLNFCIDQDRSMKFPSVELKETLEAYPMLEKERLQIQLSVLSEQPEFKNLSEHMKIYDIIYNTGIFSTFTEVYKLLQILITTPMTTAEPERCFSVLKRIKTFLTKSMGRNRLTALAMLSIEKNMIANISDFNERVINKFVSQKERRLKFNYR
ncbi:zinc finger MYM-type protein 1-like [Arctopsyche grandis]|uniref:zinc finger MYM-type protein 1-like n=1 Tax=Arctopsyche grandis TaxID=121162 RepID=UPI00406D7EF5